MDAAAIQRSARDIPILALFVGVWCEDHHPEKKRSPWVPPRVVAGLFEDTPPPELCPDCCKTLGYAVGQRILCPFDPKPDCKKCLTPCYRDEHRQAMRTIMRYSGWQLLLRGHFEFLWKYFF